MKILKIITYLYFLTILSTPSLSQTSKYGDLFEFNEFNWNKNANEIIDCEDFFLIADPVSARAFINHDCAIFPNIRGGVQSLIKLQEYPKETQEFQISGIVKVSALIDKSGKLYCYAIKTELGDIFKNQAEAVLKHLEFEKAICNNRPVAYLSTFQLKYEFQKARKNKRLDKGK